MNKITLFLTLPMFVLMPLFASAQDIPANTKAKIEETAKAKNISERKREAWINRQIEAWESINAMVFSIPKTDVEKIKTSAQEKFPWHFSKQETFIAEQSEALTEIFELKSNFNKGEFEPLFSALRAEKNGDYRAVADALNAAIESKGEIDQFVIEGIDKQLFEIIKKGAAAQYPTDLKAQLAALQKMASLVELANEAKASKESAQSAEVKVSRTEQIKKAEEIFKKSTLTINGNGKTATGIVMKVKGENALIFPAELYSSSGLAAINSAGEEVNISLKKVFAAKNAPLMLVFLPELPIELVPFEFASNNEIRECIGKDVILIGNYGEMIRPVLMKLTKAVRENLKTISPVLNMYYEGSMLLHPKTYKPLGFCVQQDKVFPDFDFTSNRLLNDYNRAVEKGSRYLDILRADIPLKWEAVNAEKMREQTKSAEQLKELNTALATIISGSFEEAKRQKLTTPIAEKYEKILSTRMDISKLRVEYRTYMNALVVMIRKHVTKIKSNDIYANLKKDLGFQLKFTNAVHEEIKKEMSNHSHTLAPKEFRKAFEDEGA